MPQPRAGTTRSAEWLRSGHIYTSYRGESGTMQAINSCNGFCDFVLYGSGVRARRRLSHSEKLPAEAAAPAAFPLMMMTAWHLSTHYPFTTFFSWVSAKRQWRWCQRGVSTEGGDKKWVTRIVSHRQCKHKSTMEAPAPSCSLLLSVSAVPSCSVRLDSAGRFSLNASKTRKKNTET